MPGSAALGDFLRARRAELHPSDVGLSGGTRRRVPGLRREEVASLAGISADYYLRIEQGRVDTPSNQVLISLARVLRLDEASAAHLHALARPDGIAAPDDADRLPDGMLSLLDQLAVPGYVVNRYLDCLASNALARSLSPNFVPGRNLLHQLFLDPADRRLHIDWDAAAVSVVGGLRQIAGVNPDDGRLIELVARLSERSTEFRALWARAPVGYRPGGDSHFMHPVVGRLDLRRQRFDVPDTGGQHLHLYHATPGTTSAERLGLLGRKIEQA
ncbi:MAG: helix-turn-helix transcriptional regulator [Lacisediminihabitans sp.]